MPGRNNGIGALEGVSRAYPGTGVTVQMPQRVWFKRVWADTHGRVRWIG